jgi:hypothetical protein
MDVEALLGRYREVLIEMDAHRVETGADPRQSNRLVNEMQSLHLQLRKTTSGRDGITALAADANETVRAWSATNALAWAPRGSPACTGNAGR